MNVTALLEDDGDVVERYMYDPYGKVTVLDADFSADADGKSDYDNRILFAGYYFDNETGLYHVRNRYYHPHFGWITRDPAGYADGMSLYEYCRSGPLGATDAMGLCTDSPEKIAEDLKNGKIKSAKELKERIEKLPKGQRGEAVRRAQEELRGWQPKNEGPVRRGGGGGGDDEEDTPWWKKALSSFTTVADLTSGNPALQLIGAYRAWRQLPEGYGLGFKADMIVPVVPEASGGGGLIVEFGGMHVGLAAKRDTNQLALTVSSSVGGGGGNPQGNAQLGFDLGVSWGGDNASGSGASWYGDAEVSGDVGFSLGGHVRYSNGFGNGPNGITFGPRAGVGISPTAVSGKVTGGVAVEAEVYSITLPVEILDRFAFPEGR